MPQKSFFFLIIVVFKHYHKTWVSHDIRITTMSWHVWECCLWKALSTLQPDFGLPDPEIPASTPGDLNKKYVWETASCVWCITFLLAVPSPAASVIGLQPTSTYFPSFQHYCVRQEKHLVSGTILFLYCQSSEFALYVISTSSQSCTNLVLCLERITIILKKSLISVSAQLLLNKRSHCFFLICGKSVHM